MLNSIQPGHVFLLSACGGLLNLILTAVLFVRVSRLYRNRPREWREPPADTRIDAQSPERMARLRELDNQLAQDNPSGGRHHATSG